MPGKSPLFCDRQCQEPLQVGIGYSTMSSYSIMCYLKVFIPSFYDYEGNIHSDNHYALMQDVAYCWRSDSVSPCLSHQPQ